MGKVNFTKEHFARLKELAFDMLISNDVVPSKFGQFLNISDLFHTTTIQTLNNIKLSLAKDIEIREQQDEWTTSDVKQQMLENIREKRELVNLIIGWKKYTAEMEELRKKKIDIQAQLLELKESQKTPEEKIREMEKELKDLDSLEDF